MALGAAIVGGAIDLVMDAPDTWLSFHVIFEIALIAGAMATSERTVRQHAVQVYEKSGLGGRAELAAFFLEDLKIPGSTAEATQFPSR